MTICQLAYDLPEAWILPILVGVGKKDSSGVFFSHLSQNASQGVRQDERDPDTESTPATYTTAS